MAQRVFSIDGKYYDVNILSLKRTGSVLDGENAGRLKNGKMIRDIIGTYYNYSLQIDADALAPAEYDELFELLSSPDDSHNVVMPYGQKVLSFEAYISEVSDELDMLYEDETRWSNLSVTFTAMLPARRPA